VRELQNVIQRAVVLAPGEVVTLDLLPGPLRQNRGSPDHLRRFDLAFAKAKQAAIDEFERSYLADVLRRASGSVAEAARLCGLDKSNFRRIVRRHGLDVTSFRTGMGAPRDGGLR
jgi:DNA-binding NtrC family response regulator